MRADYCHNEILVRSLRQVAEECGATVRVEVAVRIDGVVNYIDVVIEKDGRRFIAEPEQESRRVGNDVRKAVAIGAELLLIATPDAPTAQACRRQLRRHPLPSSKLTVIACPLGAAREILRQTLNADYIQTLPIGPTRRKET